MNSLPPRLFAPALAAYGLAWKAAKGLLSGHKRLKHGYAERLAPENWAQPVEVWIQTASGGEAYLTAVSYTHLRRRRCLYLLMLARS